MPSVPIRPLHIEQPMKREHKISKVLAVSHQFLEAHNYIWFNDHWLKALNFDPKETLMLKNPTSPETSRLRTTLIPNLLALIPKNRPFRESFRLFEIGRVFCPLQKNKECLEKHHLGGVAFQRAGSLEEFYVSVKSAVEDVFASCGVSGVTFSEPSAKNADYVWQTLGNFVTINSAGAAGFAPPVLGTLGILDKGFMPKVCKEGGQVVWFEIDLEKVSGTLYPSVRFEEPPRYPLSWQDFSLLWSVDAGFGKLESLLDRFESPLVMRREFLVSYRGKGLEKGSACYSFRFWIGSSERTLSGEEIESFHQQFLTFIKESNVSLRT
jgi:phenylalanyl-tRNA synthetase beta chain